MLVDRPAYKKPRVIKKIEYTQTIKKLQCLVGFELKTIISDVIC